MKAYYTSRKQRKGRMNAEVFDLITWDDVEPALKGTSKMLRCGI